MRVSQRLLEEELRGLGGPTIEDELNRRADLVGEAAKIDATQA